MSSQAAEMRPVTVFGALANKALQHALRGIEQGHLTIAMPFGQCLSFGGQRPGPRAVMKIHSWKFLRFLVTGSEIDFAESYMAGEWSTPDLPALLNFFGGNAYAGAPLRGLTMPQAFSRFRHALNRNTRRGSRRNIAAHYDLGNAFYAEWLDPSMTYSSALYSSDRQSLDDAQQAKLARIAQLLDLTGRETVLEIGSGWGRLAATLADRHGCSVTGLTLSTEQLVYAQQQAKQHESNGRCEFRLQDYRDAGGTYDRVVSIEMLEAVGQAYWPAYFSKLRERLRPGGVAVLQVISIGQQQFDSYRSQPDFIQRYIFPGGMLPTVEIVKEQIVGAGLRLMSAEFFGESYARTLADWRMRFLNEWPAIQSLGFDIRFKRMWEYYLAYCQAGFEVGALNVGLYKIVRPF